MPALLPILPYLGPIIAGAGAAGKFAQGMKQDHLASSVFVPEAIQTISPFAQQSRDLASQMFNGQMAGASTAAKNIFGNQANTNAGIDRNAQSGAQALALLSASQGQTNNAFVQLGQQEGNYKLNALNNLNNANAAMTGEKDKMYEADLRKRMEAINEKNALRGSAMQNKFGAIKDLSSVGYAIGSMKGNYYGNTNGNYDGNNYGGNTNNYGNNGGMNGGMPG
jgi:hypothetical protein